MIGPLDASLLPAGVTARHVEGVGPLRMHVLEAGEASAPLVLLLHGFPEIAYSWRGVMPALAAAGYRAVAPDLRGYGRTTGVPPDEAGDFGLSACLRDMLALVARLGRRRVALLVGHDFGAVAAAYCALARPDIFRAVALMSAPFAGTPPWPETPPAPVRDLDAELARLDPPRKHYHAYYSTPRADRDMTAPPEGLHAFLRAYFHVKSGDWPGNDPVPLPDASAASFARLPHYYVMPRAATMPEAVAPYMPDAAAIAACRWLPEDVLAVYAAEYARVGFQGGLNWYRGRTGGQHGRDLAAHAGRAIDMPAAFIGGARDWGVHQTYGAFAAMQGRGCTDLRICTLLDGAGHWVQQERAEAVSALLIGFLRDLPTTTEGM
ncbi:alpha/beta fold hydrolase [Acidisphaera rubrifaciens]|uniref:Epoxide hydrolase n=1 Tax=Acidisphaera rubrifaciens HS-AP3 TaxID=1231350 RepID=A0A0D6P6F9_9PROT|nr:alpha/beta hydrolase [Acidisphaera rubrifaciens]GAN76783.1 epoxide hydrolase [Acidisphaera rubrifaciens HS-AP3]